MKQKEPFYKRLKEALSLSGLTQAELSKKSGIWASSISDYLNNKYEAKQDKVDLLAKALNVSPSWLLGYDVPMERKNALMPEDSNIEPIDLTDSINIPVVGRIPAGIPVQAIEDIIEYIDIPKDWAKGDRKFVGLRVDGDSMYPLLLDGDTVVIQVQPSAETGDICACYVNGYDATLKRISLTETSITLKPENPNYPPTTYTHPGEVTIVGKVVEVRRKL